MSARASKTQNGDLIVTGDLTVLGGINSATTSKTQKTAESSTVESVKLSGDMTAVQEELADISSDNVLSPSDKIIAKGEWTNIQAEEPYVLTQAATRGFGVGDTEYDNYLAAYDDLDDYITPLLADMDSSSTIDGDEFRSYFNGYYEMRQALFSAEDQTGDIQSDATTTGGVPRFKFNLLNGEITVKKDDGTDIFKFDPTAQSLTVRGTIYADAGEFAGNLNGAYGRLGAISSDIKYNTTVVFPAGTTQNAVYDWWVANIDTTPEGSMWAIVGTYGTRILYAGGIEISTSTLKIYNSSTTLEFVNGSSTTISSKLTLEKIYYPTKSFGHIYPSHGDTFNLGFLATPWKYVIAKNIVARDTTNNKTSFISQHPTYDGCLLIKESEGSSTNLFIGAISGNGYLYCSGSAMHFGHDGHMKWMSAWDDTNSVVTLKRVGGVRLRVQATYPNYALQGNSVAYSTLWTAFTNVLTTTNDMCVVSGGIYNSSTSYVLSHALRYDSNTVRLFYITAGGTASYFSITNTTTTFSYVSLAF